MVRKCCRNTPEIHQSFANFTPKIAIQKCRTRNLTQNEKFLEELSIENEPFGATVRACNRIDNEANKQPNKQASKQTNERTHKQTSNQAIACSMKKATDQRSHQQSSNRFIDASINNLTNSQDKQTRNQKRSASVQITGPNKHPLHQSFQSLPPIDLSGHPSINQLDNR